MVEHQCECERPEFVSRIKEGMLADDVIRELADFFKIFGDCTRIRILWALHEDEMCVQEIGEYVGMSVSAVSHQLKALKEADLVKTERRGKNVYYSLCDEHIELELNTALNHIQERKE